MNDRSDTIRQVAAALVHVRLHADRVAGRDRDHRRPDRPAPARGPGGPRGRPARPVRQQPEADRPGACTTTTRPTTPSRWAASEYTSRPTPTGTTTSSGTTGAPRADARLPRAERGVQRRATSRSGNNDGGTTTTSTARSRCPDRRLPLPLRPQLPERNNADNGNGSNDNSYVGSMGTTTITPQQSTRRREHRAVHYYILRPPRHHRRLLEHGRLLRGAGRQPRQTPHNG